MIQTFCGYSGLINFISCLTLGLFVFWKNPSGRIHRSFCTFTFTVAVWALGYFLWLLFPRTQELALLWARLLTAGAVVIPATFFHFVVAFVGEDARYRRSLALCYGISTVLFGLSWTPLLIQRLEPRLWFDNWLVEAPLYHFFVAFFLAVVIASHMLLARAVKQARGVEKRQKRLVFLGTLIAFSGGSTNFFLFYHLPIPPVLNVLVPVYVALVSYAIVRHRLLDIEVVIKKTLVFAALAFAVFALLASSSFVLTQLLEQQLGGHTRLWIFAVLGVIAAAAVRPLEIFLAQVTDRFLFQKKYDYHKLLRENSKQMALIRSLDELCKQIVVFLIRQGRIKNAAMFVRDETGGTFVPKYPLGYGGRAQRPRLTLVREDALVRWLQDKRVPVRREGMAELAQRERDQGSPSRAQDLEAMGRTLEALQAEVVIPSFLGVSVSKPAGTGSRLDLRNLLVLGPKKSDEEYSEEDLDVFYTIAQDSAIAAENARLFDEAVEERKKAQAAMEAAIAAKRKTEEMELELVRTEKLRFVAELVKGLAHEIFNPMTAMMHHIERLDTVLTKLYEFYDGRREVVPGAERDALVEEFRAFREALRVLNVSTEHIFLVVDTLTQMQRRDDASIRPFDLKSFWKNAYAMMGMELHGETLAEVPVVEDIPKSLPPVLGNATQLTQVVLNLFRNSCFAMNGRSEKKITVQARLDPGHPDFVQFVFSDTGQGIPAHVLPRIFDFGFTTKGSSGQGIGLNQCKLIVERFGGTIRCESQVGQGTTFVIRLAAAKESSRAH